MPQCTMKNPTLQRVDHRMMAFGVQQLFNFRSILDPKRYWHLNPLVLSRNRWSNATKVLCRGLDMAIIFCSCWIPIVVSRYSVSPRTRSRIFYPRKIKPNRCALFGRPKITKKWRGVLPRYSSALSATKFIFWPSNQWANLARAIVQNRYMPISVHNKSTVKFDSDDCGGCRQNHTQDGLRPPPLQLFRRRKDDNDDGSAPWLDLLLFVSWICFLTFTNR